MKYEIAKICPDCTTEIAPKCKQCPVCGFSFYRKVKDPNAKKVEYSLSKQLLLEELIVSLISKLDDLNLSSSKQINYAATEKYLKRIDEKLNNLLSEKKRRTWVKVGIIKELTGWNNRSMDKARKNNLVELRNINGKIEYLLESIHPMFIKLNKDLI